MAYLSLIRCFFAPMCNVYPCISCFTSTVNSLGHVGGGVNCIFGRCIIFMYYVNMLTSQN